MACTAGTQIEETVHIQIEETVLILNLTFFQEFFRGGSVVMQISANFSVVFRPNFGFLRG